MFSENKGFTLVELLVVLALLASILAIGVPSYGRYLDASRLKADANSLTLLNKATYLYGAQKSVPPGEDIFRDTNSKAERFEALIEKDLIDKAPVPQTPANVFSWSVSHQRWVDSIIRPDQASLIRYDFTSGDHAPKDFDLSHERHWENEDGVLKGSYGRLYIPLEKESYTLSSRAQLEENGEDNSGYGILIETSLDSGDPKKDSGYALQFDRGLGNIALRKRTNGSEGHHPVDTFNLNAIDSEISNKDNPWWTEPHDLKVTIQKDPDNSGKKKLSLTIDGTPIFSDYRIDANPHTEKNHTGFRSWGAETRYESLEIE